MEIRKRFFGNIAVFYITGKIDINSAAIIEKTGMLLKEGIKKILCNFENVSMVDHDGLSLLAIAYKNVINQEGVLKFCNIPGHIKGLLRTARLDRVFEIYPDEKSALQGFDLSSEVDKLALRRKFKRVDVNIPLKYKVGLSANDKLLKGKILNLSGEGLYLFAKETFPVSTQLYLEAPLDPGKRPITIMGAVIWLADKELQPHSYPGMGIKFMRTGKKTENTIIDFIDKNITIRSKS